jgi:hypothetical protein
MQFSYSFEQIVEFSSKSRNFTLLAEFLLGQVERPGSELSRNLSSGFV